MSRRQCVTVMLRRQLGRIDIDSRTLNVLLYVTGSGLIPWRFRDFYYLMRWRLFKDHYALRRLAGIHRTW